METGNICSKLPSSPPLPLSSPFSPLPLSVLSPLPLFLSSFCPFLLAALLFFSLVLLFLSLERQHKSSWDRAVGVRVSQCFPIALCTCTVFVCAFVGVVFNIVLVMCQLSCCCSGLSCLHVVLWCVGVVHVVFCVFHSQLCLIQPLCQIQPLCAFQSSGRNNGW